LIKPENAYDLRKSGLERADWNTTVVRDVVAEEVMELKARPGGDLALGGADLAAAFMRHEAGA